MSESIEELYIFAPTNKYQSFNNEETNDQYSFTYSQLTDIFDTKGLIRGLIEVCREEVYNVPMPGDLLRKLQNIKHQNDKLPSIYVLPEARFYSFIDSLKMTKLQYLDLYLGIKSKYYSHNGMAELPYYQENDEDIKEDECFTEINDGYPEYREDSDTNYSD